MGGSYTGLQFIAAEPDRIPEWRLQVAWRDRLLAGLSLPLCGGGTVDILDFGKLNRNEGPDFRNAIVRIDGRILSGDIEIHFKTSDWFRHHHGSDPRYDSVVLHVVYRHDLESTTGMPPVLELCSHLQKLPSRSTETYSEISFSQKLSWAAKSMQERRADTNAAGRYRLMRRANWFYYSFHPTVCDWQTLVYTGVMEALGYARNSGNFIELARRVPIDLFTLLIRHHRGRQHAGLAALLGTAGLLEECIRLGYGESVRWWWREVQNVARFHTMQARSWLLFRIRPSNHPVHRIAGFVRLLSSIDGDLLSEIKSRMDSPNPVGSLTDLFIVAEPGFTFIGFQRASEIVVNAVYPLLVAQALQEGRAEVPGILMNQLSKAKCGEQNASIRRMSELLGLPNRGLSALEGQGLLEMAARLDRGIPVDDRDQDSSIRWA